MYRTPSLLRLQYRKPASRRRYSLEELAIATGLTTDEIDAAERGMPVHEQHVHRIEHALG
ncbi:DNA-binding protein [Rhizobium sp. S152]|uniref:DNA-binding protein n=1 Tax=Rhizobium sp. S152 TaxID=3055038 RepID=UPI0025A9368F|nr:DNA-binding protein [Rhizobium sp. S152]MDM9625205.1 DNA-binding protein [Rhizobium sp. S152]